MGNYGEDTDPNIPQMTDLGRNLFLIVQPKLLSDQWTIDATTRVTSFHDGTNRIRLKVKFDPTQVPS